MSWDWISWRWVRRVGLGMIGLIILLRVLAFTPLAHSFVEARLEAVSMRGQSVKVENLSGDLFGRFSVDRVSVADETGTWMTANELTASWRVLPLLWGKFYLNEARAETIEARRRPVFQSPQPRSSNGSGFLNAFVLERVAVSEIILADGVAGPEQVYRLDASLRISGAIGDVVASLTPLNGGGDEVELDIGWGDDVPIRGQMSITGAPNGLIAKLLQIPQDAGFSAKAEAVGTANAWTLTASSQIEEDAWFTASAHQDATQMTAEGSVSLQAIGAVAALRERFGDRADWRINLARPDGAITGTLETDSLIANVSGNRNPDESTLRLAPFKADVTALDSPRLLGQDGLEFSAFSADGQLSVWSGSSFAFDGEIRAPKIRYNDYQVEGVVSQGRFGLVDRVLALETKLAGSSVIGLPSQITFENRPNAQVEVDAQMDLADMSALIDRLSVQIGESSLTAMGEISRRGAVDISGDLSVPDLQGMVALEGDWTIEGMNVSAFTSRFSGIADLSGAPGDWRDLAGTSADLNLVIQRTPDDISVDRASVRSDRLTMMAQGQLSSGLIALNGQANLAGMSRSGVTADTINTEFSLLGPFVAPVLNVVATAPRLQISNQDLTNVRLRLDDVVLNELSGQTSLQAELQGAPLSSSIAFQRRGRLVEIRSGLATWNTYRLDLTGHVDPVSPRQSDLQIDLSGNDASLGQLEGGLRYQDETLNAVIALKDVKFADLTLERAELSAAGQWPTFDGKASYQGDVLWLGARADVSGDQSFSLDGRQRRVDLRGDLSIADQTIAIEAPTYFSLSQTPAMSATLKAFNGRVSLDIDPSGETRSSLKLRDIAMSQIGVLINRPALLGTLSGDAQIQIDSGALSGTGVVNLIGLARGDLTDVTTDLAATLSIEENRLALEAEAKDEDETLELGLVFETMLRHRGSLLTAGLEPRAARPTRLTGRGQVAPIWALVAPSDLRLEGIFETDLANGDGTSSRFTGRAKLDDGAFEDGFSGLHLKDMHIEALIDPSGIQLSRAEARGARSGRVAATGVYGFDDTGDIQVQLSSLDAFNRSDVTASVSGGLSINRRNRLTRVQGDLEIDRANVDLSRLPRAGYTTLDVTFASEDDAEPTATPQREAINLDLGITADRGIFVDGAGVDTEWAARLRVKGPAGAPEVTGRSTLVRGEADLLGRRFRFAEGVLRFLGDVDETEIQVRADRTSGGITSSVGVTGTFSDPRIELSSDPQVPDDEILARVLFGRSPSELSPLQAAQLATAAAQLAGGNAFNLVGQLEAATGLDRLDLGFDDDGSATLATGKYLAEDVYLEIESGVTGAPGVALEWTPLENVAVDAEIDPELGPKIALQWTQDFDRLPFDDAAEESE